MLYPTKEKFIAMLAVLVIVSGCAAQTEIIKMYEDKTVRNQPYDKFLVISVATNIGERRRLEELISSNLESDGTAAVAGHKIMGLTPTVLQRDIDAAATETDADAILITHIVSVDKRVEVQEGRTDVFFECRSGTPTDYFLYDREELKLPDSIMIAHTVIAVTNVYDVASNARRWTIQSTCFEKASMDEVLQDEAKAIVQQLRIDNLIR